MSSSLTMYDEVKILRARICELEAKKASSGNGTVTPANPSWQDTLNKSSILDKDNTVVNKGFAFTFQDGTVVMTSTTTPSIRTILDGSSINITDNTGGTYKGSLNYNAVTKSFWVTFTDGTTGELIDIGVDTTRGFYVGKEDGNFLLQVLPNGKVVIKNVASTQAGDSGLFISPTGEIRKGASASPNLQVVTDAGNITTDKIFSLAYDGTSNDILTRKGVRFVYADEIATGNLAVGVGALAVNTSGTFNVAVGTGSANSPLSLNTTGFQNMAIGGGALGLNTSGYNNVAIGTTALKVNTTGYRNIAIGGSSMNANVGGTENVAVGVSSLAFATGDKQTALGFSSLVHCTTGTENTAIGHNTLFTNTVGSFNTALGRSAAYTTLGSNNTALGYYAYFNGTGNSNVVIGANAASNISTGDNNIFIGTSVAAPAGSGSNQLAIGGYITGDGTTMNLLKNTKVTAKLLDGTAGAGTSGQVLSSTGTGVKWIDSTGGSGGSPQTLQEVLDTGAVLSKDNIIETSGNFLQISNNGTTNPWTIVTGDQFTMQDTVGNSCGMTTYGVFQNTADNQSANIGNKQVYLSGTDVFLNIDDGKVDIDTNNRFGSVITGTPANLNMKYGNFHLGGGMRTDLDSSGGDALNSGILRVYADVVDDQGTSEPLNGQAGIDFFVGGTLALQLRQPVGGGTPYMVFPLLQNYSNDAAAAAAGLPINGVYLRTGTLQARVS